ncbi:phage tail family protein [Bacillus toyonensis]|uniref:phage tail family protein n=1 Tax=Bacillus toyonensis TaxID=155322 RepID=UPI000CD9C377|nr:phage tail family protein [Bacillus toyonensis]MED3538263.1 phage tail family protein [Bacillus toyonensis]MEE2016998.1 phage tail family protein [Bacillus toyonensis]
MVDIVIDNELASNYGISLVGRPKIPTAEQEVEFIQIPGRHGSLTKKGAFKDVSLKIKFNMLELEGDLKPLIRRMKARLMKGKTLSFTDDEHVYRKIKHVEIGDIENEIEEHGEFEANFTFDPFEYAMVMPLTLTESQILFNPGTFEAAPRLEVFGSGDLRITINDSSFQIKAVTNSVVVDSELLIAHSGTTPMKTIGAFPVLSEGNNTIQWSSNVTKIIIEPRWRYK